MHLLSVIVASILSFLNFNQLAAASAAFFDVHQTGPQATILFAGDMMFDRSIRMVVEKKGGHFIFFCVDATLRGADLVVANLEGPITDKKSLSVGSKPGEPRNFVFTFPKSTAKLLKDHHIDMVNLGNNHILNFGYDGARSTIVALDAADVAHFGDPVHFGVATTSINGIALAFINYNEFGGKASTTRQQIAAAKSAGFLPIVYAHWGVEYEPIAPAYIRTLAHSFVDAGAIAVIGSHPHVVEDNETYQGVPIYYSLGNFIFDQYFQESVRNGLLLKLTFDEEGVSAIQDIPIELNRDWTVCPVE